MAIAARDVEPRAAEILDEVERAVIGKRPQIELVLMGLLADGHVLIEDFPGLAKTLIARSVARVCSMRFSRIQFTPDLMPSDVTGSAIYDQRDAVFRFQPGPVFANLLLADEINRAPPKTQAALLEAMQEQQVTADGHTHPLERPFIVLATQNPIEYEGTYPLPEAQLDRFLMRISVGYPARDDERRLLLERAERRADEVDLQVVCDRETLLELQQAVEEVHVSEPIASYMVDIVAATRDAPQIQVGASPRGSLALLKLARCSAALQGRDFVTPEDVKAIAVPALAHRLTLQPELWVQQVSAEDVVRDLLETVPVPPTQEGSSPPDDVGEPEAGRVCGACRRRPAGGARARPTRLRRAVGAVRRRARRRRRGVTPPGAAHRASAWTRRACSREARSGLISTFGPTVRRNGSSSSSCSPRESPRSETPAGPRSGSTRGEPALRLRARLRALGRLPDRARRRSDPERVRPALDDGTDRRRAAASGLPPPGAPAPRRAGVRHDPVLRQPGVPGQGGGNRVRRHSPVRARRPRPSGQLAGERPPRADVRQREPPRARERRDPLPRQLRRGAGVG